ncbi:hypothetical protein ZWY2020_053688 [Hordeum vulgare]|nr:hypothetical protein ZWY2020_053688 [Hordeum vulgare]
MDIRGIDGSVPKGFETRVGFITILDWSVISELWFALSWILDQLPKWSPVTRETYLDRRRNSCYISDDSASMLYFDTLSETAEPIASSPVAGEKHPPEDRNG